MAKDDDKGVRADKWLWSIRAFKTRTLAADACKNNKITIGGSSIKASREIKIGDVVSIKKMPVIYSFKVIEKLTSRVSAKNVGLYAQNITPQSELDKLIYNTDVFVHREKGAGRPTKKERRDIDSLMTDFFFDDDNSGMEDTD